jgi:hypothetical protein
MISGRIMMQGYAGQLGDERTVHIDIRGGDEWVYAEREGTTLEVWSGPACMACQFTTQGLKRCQLHAGCELVALQLRFA